MGHFGTIPVHPFHPMVQWAQGVANGTLWYDPSPSIPSHGEVGWNGQWEHKYGTLWYDPSLSIPSHGTVGWDGQLGQGVVNGTLWYDPSLSIPSHGEVGWNGQWGHKWDTLVQSQTIQNSTVWDSQCTIGRLLAILDMCVIFPWISPSFSSLAIVVKWLFDQSTVALHVLRPSHRRDFDRYTV